MEKESKEDRKKKYQKEYHKRNRDKINKYLRERRAKDKEKARAFDAKYRDNYHKNSPVSCILRTARNRAKKRNIPFSITPDDVVMPEVCSVLGIKLEFGRTGKPGGLPNSPSLDKIDNDLGYVPGNVQIISHLANSMKSTANKEQLLKFAAWVNTFYGEH